MRVCDVSSSVCLLHAILRASGTVIEPGCPSIALHRTQCSHGLGSTSWWLSPGNGPRSGPASPRVIGTERMIWTENNEPCIGSGGSPRRGAYPEA